MPEIELFDGNYDGANKLHTHISNAKENVLECDWQRHIKTEKHLFILVIKTHYKRKSLTVLIIDDIYK